MEEIETKEKSSKKDEFEPYLNIFRIFSPDLHKPEDEEDESSENESEEIPEDESIYESERENPEDESEDENELDEPEKEELDEIKNAYRVYQKKHKDLPKTLGEFIDELDQINERE